MMETKPATAPPAAAKPYADAPHAPSAKAGAAPAAKPEPAPAPRPLAAQRRAPSADARDPAVAALIAELEQRPPPEWRERIAALKREGRIEHAEALAAEYKRRFPDEPPPAER